MYRNFLLCDNRLNLNRNSSVDNKKILSDLLEIEKIAQ